MTGRQLFKKFKFILIGIVWVFNLFPRFLRYYFWNLSKPHSQLLFVGFRYILLKSLIKSCGDNIRIGSNVRILGWEKLKMGSNISIHDNCYIDAEGNLEIEDNVSIAHATSILTTEHQWQDTSTPIKYNPLLYKKAIIKKDVWIGCGCRILSGITINERSIVAAGAVVNRDIEGNSLYAGVPAKLIKRI